MIKLVGLLVVALGFGLRLNTLVVVLAAGLATGLAGGMSPHQVIELFGRYFVENRYMTLPVVLMVPLIGLLERHGLQERAVTLIRRARAATAGRIILLYALARQISVALGLNIGSSGGAHAGFVRPLVAPMAEAAARASAPDPDAPLPEKTSELIRANAAAAENTGNFFGEDIFIAVGAILLMKGFFETKKIEVSMMAMALWGIPTAIAASLVLWWRMRALDRRVARELRMPAKDKDAP
ncbi:MAG TPA: DUF969 family protein [Candidatus Didemnitutus sp.]|jgi:uncharacterized membrane protein